MQCTETTVAPGRHIVMIDFQQIYNIVGLHIATKLKSLYTAIGKKLLRRSLLTCAASLFSGAA